MSASSASRSAIALLSSSLSSLTRTSTFCANFSKLFSPINPGKPSSSSSSVFSSPVRMSSTEAPSEAKKGPVETTMEEKLTKAFAPKFLKIVNESHMHNVPRGSETHFKVLVVSSSFESLALIARHRAVNETLKEELSSGVHALSIVAKTVGQWEEAGGKKEEVEGSPACRGGFGK